MQGELPQLLILMGQGEGEARHLVASEVTALYRDQVLPERIEQRIAGMRVENRPARGAAGTDGAGGGVGGAAGGPVAAGGANAGGGRWGNAGLGGGGMNGATGGINGAASTNVGGGGYGRRSRQFACGCRPCGLPGARRGSRLS